MWVTVACIKSVCVWCTYVGVIQACPVFPLQVVNSFKVYKQHSLRSIKKREDYLNTLPAEHQKLLRHPTWPVPLCSAHAPLTGFVPSARCRQPILSLTPKQRPCLVVSCHLKTVQPWQTFCPIFRVADLYPVWAVSLCRIQSFNWGLLMKKILFRRNFFLRITGTDGMY